MQAAGPPEGIVMRIVSLTVIGALAFGTAAAAATQGVPGWPASSPRAVYSVNASSNAEFSKGSRQVAAQRAANMINGGDCKGALRMMLREREYELADRVADVCHIDKAGRPI